MTDVSGSGLSSIVSTADWGIGLSIAISVSGVVVLLLVGICLSSKFGGSVTTSLEIWRFCSF